MFGGELKFEKVKIYELFLKYNLIDFLIYATRMEEVSSDRRLIYACLYLI